MNIPTPYNGKEKYIFVSYSHKDTELVYPIIVRLISAGFRVWFDQGIDPGTEWDENIAQHINECGHFAAFISKNYLASNNCKDELNYARDLEKERLIVYLEDIKLPSGMAMRINRLQSIFMYTYKDKEAFYDKLFSAKNLHCCRVGGAPVVTRSQPQPVQQVAVHSVPHHVPQSAQQAPRVTPQGAPAQPYYPARPAAVQRAPQQTTVAPKPQAPAPKPQAPAPKPQAPAPGQMHHTPKPAAPAPQRTVPAPKPAAPDSQPAATPAVSTVVNNEKTISSKRVPWIKKPLVSWISFGAGSVAAIVELASRYFEETVLPAFIFMVAFFLVSLIGAKGKVAKIIMSAVLAIAILQLFFSANTYSIYPDDSCLIAFVLSFLLAIPAWVVFLIVFRKNKAKKK